MFIIRLALHHQVLPLLSICIIEESVSIIAIYAPMIYTAPYVMFLMASSRYR